MDQLTLISKLGKNRGVAAAMIGAGIGFLILYAIWTEHKFIGLAIMSALFIITGLLFFGMRIEKFSFLVLLLVFIPMSISIRSVPGWQPYEILLPILLLLYLSRSAIKRERPLRTPRFSIPLLLFLIIACLHILTLPNLSEVIKSFLNLKIAQGGYRIYYAVLMCGIVYFLTPCLFKTEEQMKSFIKVLSVILFLQIIISFVRIFLGIETLPYPFDTYGTRIYSVVSEQGTSFRVGVLGNAGYLLFLILLIFMRQHLNKIIFICLVGICIVAVILSGYRIGFLSLIISTLFFWYLTGRKRKAVVGIILILPVLLILGLNAGIVREMPAVFHRPLGVLSPDNPSWTRGQNTRLEMWTIAKEKIIRNPLWGGEVSDVGFHPKAFDNVKRGGAHNLYLSVMATFGIPALIFWLIFAISYFRKAVYLYRKTYNFPSLNRFCLFLAILLGVSFFNFFGEGGAAGGVPFFLYLGLIDVAWNIYLKNKAGTKQ